MADKKLIINPKRPRGEDGHKTFSIRVRDDTVEHLDSIAAQTGRSRNELINLFLDFAIENCEIEQ